VADNKKVFALGTLIEKFLEVFEGRVGCQGGRVLDLGLVACFGAEKRGCLKAAFKRA